MNASGYSPVLFDLSDETAFNDFSWENSKCQQINYQYYIDKMPQKHYVQRNDLEPGVSFAVINIVNNFKKH